MRAKSMPDGADGSVTKRILIVDNLPQMRKLIRDYLEEERSSAFAAKPSMVLTP